MGLGLGLGLGLGQGQGWAHPRSRSCAIGTTGQAWPLEGGLLLLLLLEEEEEEAVGPLAWRGPAAGFWLDQPLFLVEQVMALLLVMVEPQSPVD